MWPLAYGGPSCSTNLGAPGARASRSCPYRSIASQRDRRRLGRRQVRLHREVGPRQVECVFPVGHEPSIVAGSVTGTGAGARIPHPRMPGFRVSGTPVPGTSGESAAPGGHGRVTARRTEPGVRLRARASPSPRCRRRTATAPESEYMARSAKIGIVEDHRHAERLVGQLRDVDVDPDVGARLRGNASPSAGTVVPLARRNVARQPRRAMPMGSRSARRFRIWGPGRHVPPRAPTWSPSVVTPKLLCASNQVFALYPGQYMARSETLDGDVGHHRGRYRRIGERRILAVPTYIVKRPFGRLPHCCARASCRPALRKDVTVRLAAVGTRIPQQQEGVEVRTGGALRVEPHSWRPPAHPPDVTAFEERLHRSTSRARRPPGAVKVTVAPKARLASSGISPPYTFTRDIGASVNEARQRLLAWHEELDGGPCWPWRRGC